MYFGVKLEHGMQFSISKRMVEEENQQFAQLHSQTHTPKLRRTSTAPLNLSNKLTSS